MHIPQPQAFPPSPSLSRARARARARAHGNGRRMLAHYLLFPLGLSLALLVAGALGLCDLTVWGATLATLVALGSLYGHVALARSLPSLPPCTRHDEESREEGGTNVRTLSPVLTFAPCDYTGDKHRASSLEGRRT